MALPSAPVLLPVAHIPQRRRGDCLAASAAMVLAYLGRPLPYNRLLKSLGVQPDVGAPFTNLQRLARHKVTVLYRQGTLAELYRLLVAGWPCIVPVKTHELPYWGNVISDHAVVVVGMDAESIFLNDPAFTAAPIQAPLGDFDLAWLGPREGPPAKVTRCWRPNHDHQGWRRRYSALAWSKSRSGAGISSETDLLSSDDAYLSCGE